MEDIALGFDHVRLGVNPKPMWQRNDADDLPAEYRYSSGRDFKEKLSSDAAVKQFADFWRALAKHYSTWDPEKVCFDTLNEPEMRDHYRWNGIQALLAVAIREGARVLTIIVEEARWADDNDLVFMEPLRDPNLIYNFIFMSGTYLRIRVGRGARVTGTT